MNRKYLLFSFFIIVTIGCNQVSVEPTSTSTQISPTDTNTPPPPSATYTSTNTLAPTPTFTPAPTSTPTLTPTPFGGYSGNLVAVQEKRGEGEIFIYSMEGEELYNLTGNLEGYKRFISWSPDKENAIFRLSVGADISPWSSIEIWRTSIDGKNQEKIFDGNWKSSTVSWSPDGKRFVTVCKYSVVCIADLETNEVIETGHVGTHPTFSPDGKTIMWTDIPDVFTFGATREVNIYLFSEGDDKPVELTSFKYLGIPRDPFWSADGKWIFYINYENPGTALYRAAVDGSENELLLSFVNNIQIDERDLSPDHSYGVVFDQDKGFEITNPRLINLNNFSLLDLTTFEYDGEEEVLQSLYWTSDEKNLILFNDGIPTLIIYPETGSSEPTEWMPWIGDFSDRDWSIQP